MTKTVNSNLIKRIPILNDPIYGFISFPFEIIYKIIEHDYFQRLRRISQLGLTHLIYPGAKHTRFEHAIGATHLMLLAIKELRSKGHEITQEEEKAACCAILLHDIGHGPFSHTLENSIVNTNHETMSVLLMKELNKQFNNELTLAIEIFENKYDKKFLHQLVSSQLDVDRMDYLKRDSFFTGVSEGVIGSDRIIKMLNIANGELCVDYKGIYSIEKFLVARRLMYWQVYLHKTAVSADFLLLMILKRAKALTEQGVRLFATESFESFLKNNYTENDFNTNSALISTFSELDDYDILASIKQWTKHQDKTLSILCEKLINRKLFKVEIQDEPFDSEKINAIKKQISKILNITLKEASYFVVCELIKNSAYNSKKDRINILMKNGEIKDIAKAADLLNISVLSEPVKKYFLCYPKDI